MEGTVEIGAIIIANIGRSFLLLHITSGLIGAGQVLHPHAIYDVGNVSVQ